MQIRAFPRHYQLVYINIDIPSFSVISYAVKNYSMKEKLAIMNTEK